MKQVLLALMIVLLFAFTASAKTVSLSWDASPSDVTGYKIYYSDTNTQPFAGTDADQPTPIDVGNNLSYTVTGLPDGVGYYFAVTAYDGVFESVYSNVVYSPGFMPPEAPSALGGVTTVNNIDIPIQ